MKLLSLSLGVLFAAGLVFARTQEPGKPASAGNPAAAPAVAKAICVLAPRSGSSVQGVVRFTQESDGVRIEAKVTGLTHGLHGFHVHEWGDLECGDGKCTGGHFNPTAAQHGKAEDPVRHVGDLGNLEANAEGVATYSRVDRQIALAGPHSIVGRGMIVHADPDDFKTQPTGNAGARVAAGVIGIADPAK